MFPTVYNKNIPLIREFYALGTNNILKVYGGNGEKAVREAAAKLYEVDDKISVFKENSEIARINKNAWQLPQNDRLKLANY